jgi:protein TonB
VFAHIGLVALVAFFRPVTLPKRATKFVTAVEGAKRDVAPIYMPLYMPRPQQAVGLDDLTIPRTPAGPSLAPPQILPTEIPPDIQDANEGGTPDILSLPLVPISPALEHLMLTWNVPQPPPDPVIPVTKLEEPVEKHAEKPAVRVGGRVVPAEPILKEPPVYPEAARRARVQGVVLLNAVVSVEGKLTEIEVVSGHPLLARAAVDCVRKWRYRPGTLNEQTIAMPITVHVQFVLNLR